MTTTKKSLIESCICAAYFQGASAQALLSHDEDVVEQMKEFKKAALLYGKKEADYLEGKL